MTSHTCINEHTHTFFYLLPITSGRLEKHDVEKTKNHSKLVELQALGSGGPTATCGSKTNVLDVLEQICPNDHNSVQIIAFIVVSHQCGEWVSQSCSLGTCVLQGMHFYTTAFCNINTRTLSQPTKTSGSGV